MTISAEGNFLFNCARIRIDSAAREQIDIAVRQDPDWAYLKRAAIKNKVLPLVYHGMMRSCPGSIPSEIVDDWRKTVDENRARQEKNQGILLDVLATLEGAGIPCVPFKGITLARFVYGDIALRTAGDVDLLVRPAHFIKARDLLIRSEYSQHYFGHAEVSTVQGALVNHEKLVMIDLHYALTPYYQHTNMDQATGGSKLPPGRANRLDTDSTHWFFWLDCEPLWERLQSVTVATRAVRILSVEDLLLVAAINGIKENWRMLIRVTDIADLVRGHPEMDWDRVFGQVSAMRFERKFEFGMLLARDLCGMPLPNEISRRIGTSASLRTLVGETCRRFRADDFEPDLEQFRLICALFSMDGFRDRAWYLAYILRRLRQWSFRASQYFAFFRKLLRQIGLWMAEATKSGGKG